jgi:hypothetical protein
VHDADLLVVDIMRTRGYPVGDTDGNTDSNTDSDFDRRAADISVEHPEIVQRYRDARAVRDATARGDVDTEQQRHAVTSYRSLVEALLTSSRSAEHHTDQIPEQRHTDQHADQPVDGYRTDGHHADGQHDHGQYDGTHRGDQHVTSEEPTR